jgi:SAM-dependent methyltransferase
MSFNCYEDGRRADAYARLEFPGTYSLAYRDLPALIAEHVHGKRALDFGCGTGRSTRFLRGLGLDATGVDISGEMILRARALDPDGCYRLVENGDLGGVTGGFDLVLSVFTFDNIPTQGEKVRNLSALGALLGERGRIVNLVSAPEVYTHEWASFSTRDFPENALARRGDVVRIVITAIDDPRPVEDVVWPDAAYRETYEEAGLSVLATHKPLATGDEPYEWVSETSVAPWVVYVLGRSGPGPRPLAP